MSATGTRQRLTLALEMALDRQRAGRELAELRESKRLTQAEVVEQTGLSLRQIQRYEAGESMPRWKNLDKLAEVLGDRVYAVVRDDPAARDRTGESDPRLDMDDEEAHIDRLEAGLAQLRQEARLRDQRRAEAEALVKDLRERVDAEGRIVVSLEEFIRLFPEHDRTPGRDVETTADRITKDVAEDDAVERGLEQPEQAEDNDAKGTGGKAS